MGKNKESPDNRSLDLATLECVFSRHNVLNGHSHSANVIGDVHKKKRTNLSTLQWKELTVAFCQLWPQLHALLNLILSG